VPLGVPGLLTVLWAAFTLAMGFLYGGQDRSAQVAASRFSHLLPMDNQLPYLFARHIQQFGHSGPPIHVGDWLSSDRPPLQSAFFLAHTLWRMPDSSAQLDLQVLGTLLQSTWVLGVWAVTLVVTERRSVRALIVAGSAVCGQVLLNSFYTWPKLLAAALALVAVALVLRTDGVRDVVRLPLAAAAAALAYLSHGGAAFALLPVAVLAAWQLLRRRELLRVGTAAVGSALVLLLPWTLYQRFFDPPGDRLLKWMLADVQPIDARSAAGAVVERYRGLGVEHVVQNKLSNVEQVWGLPLQSFPLHASDEIGTVVRFLRGVWFYELIPSFGLLLVLVVGFLGARRARATELQAQLRLAGVCCAGVLGWCLLMFGPRTTLTHQGTYAFTLMGAAILVGVGAMASVRATVMVVGLQGLLTLLVYAPLSPEAGVPWMETAHVAKQSIVLAIGAGAALVVVLGAYSRSRHGSSAAAPRVAHAGAPFADTASAIVISTLAAAADLGDARAPEGTVSLPAARAAADDTATTGPEGSLDRE